MKKPSKPTDNRKPVSRVVHEILDQGRMTRADGPFSGLYGRDAQLSGALTQAGTLLAKLDKTGLQRKSSVLHQVLGSIGAPAKPRRRSWFFAATPAAMPDAKRIEQMLQAATKDGRPLVLDLDLPRSPTASNNDIDCRLPPDATDPVCEPR